MERKEMEVTRRTLVEGALTVGAATLVLGCAGSGKRLAFAQDATAPGEDAATAPGDASQHGFLVRTNKCINCGKCVEACRFWSRTPEGMESRRKVTAYYDDLGREYFLSLGCMHCENPSCLTVCPAGAIEKGEGGIVTVNKDRCIGCKYCYQACPFGIPNYGPAGMDKCDYCFGAGVALGERPRCVEACKVGALKHGKLEDLLAWSNRAERIGGPTEPSYVLL